MPTLMASPPSPARSRKPALPAVLPRTGPHDLARLLPSKGDPDYLWVLCEMVRADLEMTWSEGRPRRLGEYRSDFPELFQDAPVLRAIACEEYHIRDAHGDHPDAKEYAKNYGVTLFERDHRANVLTDTIAGKVKVMRDLPAESPAAGDYLLSSNVPGEAVIATAQPATFPAVGETFLGFRLSEELGRGAFARVYLARQIALADRPVALKVTTRPTQEPDRLAKLQHTNIVPIFSVHSAGMLQAVCMPYLGRATLADTLNALRKNGHSPISGSELFSTVEDAATVPDAPCDSPTPPNGIPLPYYDPELSPQPVRDMLARMSYLDAVAWVIARLAEGLAHAHRRGIRHYDLKPANVLLGDDGQPMLLDFNLAHDVTAGKREQLGGTIMYMAPEQLEEVRDQAPGRVTEQTDLYSLGVIFFELLTGRHPFALTGQSNKVAAALELRKAGPPSVRALNPSVSPAVEAIVHKLLDPNPANRYASAEFLGTDLDRHAIHLPLLYAPEPSLRESFRKWRYRSPGVIRRMGFLAAVLTVTVAGAWAYTAQQANRVAAADDAARRFRTDLATLRVDLTSPDSATAAAGAKKATDWLASFGVTEAGAGKLADHPLVRRLGPDDRAALAADLGETAALLAMSERPTDPAAKARAGRWFAAAAACFRGQPVPDTVRDGQTTASRGDPAPAADDETPRAAFLRGTALFLTGQYADAAILFEAVTRAHPDHYAGQFLLGRCRHELGEYAGALERFDMARALAPDDYRPMYNRGLSLMKCGRAAEADAEFTAALALAPTFANGYYHRALAREKKNPKGALADLARAAELGGETVFLHAVRARVYKERIGDASLAAACNEAILKVEPKTELDYRVRGYALQVMHRWAEALAAYQRATELNPKDYVSWINQASVLEKLDGKLEDRLSALDRAVVANPRSTDAVINRAVIHARLGHRNEAHEDVVRGLELNPTGRLVHQAACAYALTSREEPKDAGLAMDLLRRAFRLGYHDTNKSYSNDPDLEALADRDDFQALVRSIGELVK